MIRKLRKKFIWTTMLALLLLLAALLVVINMVNIVNSNRQADEVTEYLLEHSGKIGDGDGEKTGDTTQRDSSDQTDKEPGPGKKGEMKNPEFAFTTRYCTVTLDGSKTITAVNMAQITAIDENAAREYTAEILSRRDSTGWIGGYKYRIGQTLSGYLIVIVDALEEQQNIVFVLRISSLVGIGTYLVTLLFVALISGRAVRPIAESYVRQKEFLNGAGHDLRTPLSVITADSEILAMNYGENEWCQSIDRQTGKMRDLVSSMIALSNMDEGHVQSVQEIFSLSGMVYETAESWRKTAEAAGLTLALSVSGDIRHKGSREEICRLVSLLMDNAVKFCDRGGTITVTLQSGKKNLLSIRNTYADSAKLKYTKLFDWFYRTNEARIADGSHGLGLPIAKSIAEANGADIRIRDVGGGVQVDVSFRRSAEKEKPPEIHKDKKETLSTVQRMVRGRKKLGSGEDQANGG